MTRLRNLLKPSQVPFWLGAATVIAAITYAVILWCLRRGFDWTDEAWAASLTASGRVTEGEAWGFHYLLHPVFALVGETVLGFRILRLVLYVALAALSTAMLARVASMLGHTLKRPEWWFVFVFAQVGTFLAWSFPPRYFAYNELSGIFTQLGVLILVVLLVESASSRESLTTRVRALLWLSIGFITALLVVAKFTAGALFAIIVVVAIIVCRGSVSLARRGWTTTAGVLAGLATLWAIGFPLASYAANASTLMFDANARAEYGHPLIPVLKTYITSLSDTSHAILVPVALFACALGLWLFPTARVRSPRSPSEIGAVVLATLAAVGIVALPPAPTFPSLGRFILLVGVFAALGVIALVSTREETARATLSRTPLVVGAAALAFAPFIAAAGTDMLLVGQLLYSATVWSAACAVALLTVASRLRDLGRKGAMFLPAFLVLFMGISGLQVARESLVHPYRSTPYQNQGYSSAAPHLQGLLLTQEEAAWADWIASESVALGAHDVPTVSLAPPGALLVFNNSDYASPWLKMTARVSFKSVGMACSTTPPHDLIVLQPVSIGPDAPEFQLLASTLESDCGIEFPDQFTVVAQRPSADERYGLVIWRLIP